jgi:hypothetical protein
MFQDLVMILELMTWFVMIGLFIIKKNHLIVVIWLLDKFSELKMIW